MGQYRQKPVVIEAVRFDTLGDVCDFVGLDHVTVPVKGNIGIVTGELESVVWSSPGDYIIKGVNGEFYPCKPDIFEKIYEEVEGESPKAAPLGDSVYGDFKQEASNVTPNIF